MSDTCSKSCEMVGDSSKERRDFSDATVVFMQKPVSTLNEQNGGVVIFPPVLPHGGSAESAQECAENMGLSVHKPMLHDLVQVVETETSPAATPPAGACGARLPTPLSAHPQPAQAHHLHGPQVVGARNFALIPRAPPRPPGMQRWRGSWTTLQVDHSHPVQLRTRASGSRQGHPYA